MKTYFELKHLTHFDNVFIINANNKDVLELMKTYLELKHLSYLDKVFIT